MNELHNIVIVGGGIGGLELATLLGGTFRQTCTSYNYFG